MIPMTQALYQTIPLECPFGFRAESFTTTRLITFFPPESDLSISFSANRSSKFLALLPLVGTIIGISRIFKSIQEYHCFANTEAHLLSNRSIQWGLRGALETIPVLGALACLIIDLGLTDKSDKLLSL